MQHGAYIPGSITVYLVITWLLRNAAASKAKHQGDTVVFGGTRLVNAISLASIVGFALASLYVAITPPRSLLGSLVFGGLAIGGAYAFPAPIHLSPTGLRQTSWWGRTVSLPWQSIVKLEFHKGPSTTVVADEAGRKVVHSGFHCDGTEFLELCRKRINLPLVSSEF